jgi:hypothetical protein
MHEMKWRALSISPYVAEARAALAAPKAGKSAPRRSAFADMISKAKTRGK